MPGNQHSLVWSRDDDVAMAIYILRGDPISVLMEQFPDRTKEALTNRLHRLFLTGPRGRANARNIIVDNDAIEQARKMGVAVGDGLPRAQRAVAQSSSLIAHSSPAIDLEE